MEAHNFNIKSKELSGSSSESNNAGFSLSTLRIRIYSTQYPLVCRKNAHTWVAQLRPSSHLKTGDAHHVCTIPNNYYYYDFTLSKLCPSTGPCKPGPQPPKWPAQQRTRCVRKLNPIRLQPGAAGVAGVCTVWPVLPVQLAEAWANLRPPTSSVIFSITT